MTMPLALTCRGSGAVECARRSRTRWVPRGCRLESPRTPHLLLRCRTRRPSRGSLGTRASYRLRGQRPNQDLQLLQQTNRLFCLVFTTAIGLSLLTMTPPGVLHHKKTAIAICISSTFSCCICFVNPFSREKARAEYYFTLRNHHFPH